MPGNLFDAFSPIVHTKAPKAPMKAKTFENSFKSGDFNLETHRFIKTLRFWCGQMKTVT